MTKVPAVLTRVREQTRVSGQGCFDVSLVHLQVPEKLSSEEG
jgi:hypothetical protein